ncbi:MAG TPA: hypothetical protein VFT64_07145 [Rickettsiales bacterium]|nr:hypothetical protein [Rickettsiales bacterium]
MRDFIPEGNHGRSGAVADYIAASLLGLMFIPCVLFIASLYADLQAWRWSIPVGGAAFVPVFCLIFLRGQRLCIKLAAVALLVLVLAKAFWLAHLFYDTSNDSMTYHADAILQLLAGVNTIYQWMHGFDDLWVNHYPKITWYFAALVTHWTGNYNFGKIDNVMLMTAVLAYLYSFLRVRGFSAGSALLAAAAASVNPVVISQIHTFYVDGALASLTTLALFSGVALLGRTRCQAADSEPEACVRPPLRHIDLFVFVSSACLLINIKFTGAAMVGIIAMVDGIIWLSRWYRSRAKEDFRGGVKLVYVMVLAGLLGGVFMGYDPYIRNMLEEGNPLYPLFGAQKTDVVAAQSPKSFNENHTSTPVRVVKSIFSRAGNIIYRVGGTAEPRLKLPFSVNMEELDLYAYNDIRIGGWGVLFSGIFCCALLIYALTPARKDAEMNAILVMILISVLINPGSWWARYAPQIALIPLVMVIPALASRIGRHRIAAGVVCLLLFANSALIVGPNTDEAALENSQIKRQISHVLAVCGKGEYEISDTQGFHFEQILAQNGIRVVYPAEDVAKTHSKSELFPLLNVYLYKPGCKPRM